jgi:hypothetical protein
MCNSCSAVMINKVLCHEYGCPDSWQDKTKECKWCGTEFKPEEKDQEFCGDDCLSSFYGYNNYDSEE